MKCRRKSPEFDVVEVTDEWLDAGAYPIGCKFDAETRVLDIRGRSTVRAGDLLLSQDGEAYMKITKHDFDLAFELMDDDACE